MGQVAVKKGLRWVRYPSQGQVSMPVSVTTAVNVYHCVNGDRLFDRQIGFRPILLLSVNLTVTEMVRVNGL